MKNKILLIALLSIVQLAQAEAATQASLATGDVLRGTFTETRHMHGFNGPMTSEGHFVVAPGYGLIWKVEKPFAISTIISPDGLRQNVDGEQVTNLEAAKIPFLTHLYQTLGGTLSGDFAGLEKDFTLIRSQQGNVWTIELTPREMDNTAMPFSAIGISGNRFAEKVHMLKKDGDTDDLTFRDQIVSHGTPDQEELKLLGAPVP